MEPAWADSCCDQVTCVSTWLSSGFLSRLPCVAFSARAVPGVAPGVARLESKCQTQVSLMHVLLARVCLSVWDKNTAAQC